MPDAKVDYEKTDVQIGSIILSGVALFVMVFIVLVIVVWLFDDLKGRENRFYPSLPALVVKERAKSAGPTDAQPPNLPGSLVNIPGPRLQQSETADLAELRKKEDTLLTTYGWVERKEGIVRIPIDEAMKMLADPTVGQVFNLPVRPVKNRPHEEDRK
jgi:hypothetical protein